MPKAGTFGSALFLPPPSITGTFQATAGSTADTTAYTFTARPLGTPSATRRIVVAVSGRNSGITVTSLTVGGVSLSLDAHSGTTTQMVEIWSGVVASGTTGDVVVTFSGTSSYCGIGVWELTAGAPTGNKATASSTATPALTVTTASGDFVVAALALRVSVAGASVTWNAATERYDAAVDGAVRQHAAADLVASGSSVDMGASVTNYAAELNGVAVAYR